jgi:hypothetical protein
MSVPIHIWDQWVRDLRNEFVSAGLPAGDIEPDHRFVMLVKMLQDHIEPRYRHPTAKTEEDLTSAIRRAFRLVD